LKSNVSAVVVKTVKDLDLLADKNWIFKCKCWLKPDNNLPSQFGMDAVKVDVEVHLANGLPAFNVVGMPETAVKESKDRVRSAIVSSKFEFPARRITVNLAPADVPKVGGRFDLPIALGILIASGQIQVSNLSSYEFIGELGLTGEVKAVSACLPTAVACQQADKQLLLPFASSQEASLVNGLSIVAVKSLLEAAAHLSGQSQLCCKWWTSFINVWSTGLRKNYVSTTF